MEVGYTRCYATIANVTHPFRIARPRTLAALSSCDDPVQACQVERWERPEQWLTRQKAYCCRAFSQGIRTRRQGIVFQRDSHPDICGPVDQLAQPTKTPGPRR